jgi:large subunit ribosomal protein L9
MRLILREEVDNLGKRGQVVNVARGFARNFLLPKRLAVEVTDANLRLIEKERKVYEAKLAKEKEEAEVVAEALSAVRLSFRRKVHGEGQDLYGSVSLADLGEALEKKGFHLEKRKILLYEPLKTLGEFTISVKLHPEVTVGIPVVVEKEEE